MKWFVTLLGWVVIMSSFIQASAADGSAGGSAGGSAAKMKVTVWDTYVTKKDGKVMHFDILAPASVTDTNVIYGYGRAYLKSKGQEGQPLTAKECRLCHTRDATPEWMKAIKEKGYFILEMEGCN